MNPKKGYVIRYPHTRAANTCLVKFDLDAIHTHLDRCLQLEANIFVAKNMEWTTSVAMVHSSSTICIGIRT